MLPVLLIPIADAQSPKWDTTNDKPTVHPSFPLSLPPPLSPSVSRYVFFPLFLPFSLSLSCLSLSLYSSIPFFHSFSCFHILLLYLSLVRAHIVRTKKFSKLLKTWQKLRTRLLKQILKSVAEPVFGFIFFSSNGKKPQVNWFRFQIFVSVWRQIFRAGSFSEQSQPD